MNAILKETLLPNGATLQLVQGDLTLEATDAIVNAANAYLQHGGGVAWAIVRRGGEIIQDESDAWVREHGLVSHASPAWTSGGNLKARYVIHAVGPIWGEGEEDAKLTAAVTGALRVADELNLASISLPALSTGIFGFPKERAAGVILSAVRAYLVTASTSLRLVRLVLYDAGTVTAFRKAWDENLFNAIQPQTTS
ncbi:MAG: macro domain-containing protein [Candidatus Villigracilaceae bacterium]